MSDERRPAEANWLLIYKARNFANDYAKDDDWSDVCDTYIQDHANDEAEAEASIIANNMAIFRAAGVI